MQFGGPSSDLRFLGTRPRAFIRKGRSQRTLGVGGCLGGALLQLAGQVAVAAAAETVAGAGRRFPAADLAPPVNVSKSGPTRT